MTDASLQKIAATYGTPTFVFDTDALQARVRAIQTIWGREIDLCYSIKANPFLLPAMMQVTARLEVCSPGELSLCESRRRRHLHSGISAAGPLSAGCCTQGRQAASRAAAAERGQSVRHVKGGSFHRIGASQGNT